MVRKVLPPLNDQNQVPNIAGSGEWKAEDATFLEKLAKGLKMSGEEVVSFLDINSVPDNSIINSLSSGLRINIFY